MGSEHAHPSDHSRPTQRQTYNDNIDEQQPQIVPQHLPSAEEIQPQREHTLDCGRVSINNPYKLMASKILTASKGKRKIIDRPKRHHRWKASHNPIRHNDPNFDTSMTSEKGIKQTIISTPRKRPIHHATSQGLRVQVKQIVQQPPPTQSCNPHQGYQPKQCNSLGHQRRHRLSIMLKPKKKCKRSTAEHSRPALTTNNINTEPLYSLRCIVKCNGGAVFWGNVYRHMIEGSGWVKPKRDVIKWFHMWARTYKKRFL